MISYIMLLIAAILLAADFLIQKMYQQSEGVGVKAGLTFNALLGLFTAIIFLFICGFKITFTPYAVIMAALMSTFAFCYTLIGFRVIKSGNVSLYTMFLMSGGMLLPYIFGVVFLNEKLLPLRIIGLVLMMLGILLPHFKNTSASKWQIAFCIIIFFLNGGCSIVSKLGQTESRFGTISADDFVFLTGLTRFLLCTAALMLYRKKEEKGSQQKFNYRKTLPLTAISASISGISYMLQLIGAAKLPATVVYPIISGGSIVFTTLAGMIFFKEKITLKQKLGVLMCFAGTFLFL